MNVQSMIRIGWVAVRPTKRLVAIPLAATLLAGCPELPLGDWTDPYYWSNVFLDKYEAELEVGELEPGPAPLEEPRYVLLITGVTIQAKWFDPIVARLERDGFVPIMWEPPALLSGDLFEASRQLGDVVDDALAQSGQAKIDILAECTGGVIARHYIQSLGGDAKVSRMVTFVSPQHGLPKAAWAHSLVGWPALEDLTPGSAFLNAVNDAPLPESVPFTSIYTCTDEYIQPYETSIIPGATNIGLGCDGGFVGHFQTFYDPEIYLVMHGALTAPLPSDGDQDPETGDGDQDPGDGDQDPGDGDQDPGNGSTDTGGGCNGGQQQGAGAGLLLVGLGIAFSLRRRRVTR